MVAATVDPAVDAGLEARHDGERRSRLPRDLPHEPIDIGAVETPVEGDHLAVEPVQRPQPKVAMLGQLSEGQVTVVRALEQRPDRRGLEEHVRLPLGVKFLLPQRLHMKRPDPALVQHAASLPLHPRGCLS